MIRQQPNRPGLSRRAFLQAGGASTANNPAAYASRLAEKMESARE